MSLLDRNDRRKHLTVFRSIFPRDIEQTYNEPARLLLSEEWVISSCMSCDDPPCMRLSEHEIECPEFPEFSYERDFSVCPVRAIRWSYESETPEIDNRLCIGCGLCAVRCPVGAIYRKDNHMGVVRRRSEQYTVRIPYTRSGVEKQRGQLTIVNKIAWKHRFQKESDQIMRKIYHALSNVDGRSMIPNLLVRNLLISLGYKCAISRSGDVYTRIDAVYSGKASWDKTLGAIEIEFGRDTLDASRSILDDIAVLHSRSNIDKDRNCAMVVCLSFPNKRQGYFQVIKDIKNVLGLEIQTLSLGALLILTWNSSIINLGKKEFYADFDHLSIRQATEFRLGRTINISEGCLGILEPKK